MAEPRDITPDDIRSQVARILQSPELETSPRLQEFLEFIVDEYLAGRAGRIKGVTIAQAVFGANDSFDPESNSIVRVEAGRLRRRLNEYYLATGASDSVIIEIPKGGYAPAFRRRETDDLAEEGAGQRNTRARRRVDRKRVLAAMVVVAGLVASWAWFTAHMASHQTPTGGNQTAEAGQPESEVDVLARQAWELLMPPEDVTRLETAKGLFDHVIDLAPDRPLGYAGKSLSLAIGVHFFKSKEPASDLAMAAQLAQKAVSLNDDYALGWAAMAFSHSLVGDRDAALAFARQAVADMPTDAITPTIVGLVLLNSDRPEDARDLMRDMLSKLPLQPRTPFLNVLGIAQYVTGDYQGAAQSFETNLANSGPWGPHMDLFLAAAYGELGQDFRASAVLEKVSRSSPEFPARQWMGQFIKRPGQLEATMARLRSLGFAVPPD